MCGNTLFAKQYLVDLKRTFNDGATPIREHRAEDFKRKGSDLVKQVHKLDPCGNRPHVALRAAKDANIL